MNTIPEQRPADTSSTSDKQAHAMTVVLPKSFTSRVNQMAHRRGKRHADMWRVTTLQALQDMANEGTSLDGLSAALEAVEADVSDRAPALAPQPDDR